MAFAQKQYSVLEQNLPRNSPRARPSKFKLASSPRLALDECLLGQLAQNLSWVSVSSYKCAISSHNVKNNVSSSPNLSLTTPPPRAMVGDHRGPPPLAARPWDHVERVNHSENLKFQSMDSKEKWNPRSPFHKIFKVTLNPFLSTE